MIEPIAACLSLVAMVAGIALGGVAVAGALDRIAGGRGRGSEVSSVASALGGGRWERWLVCFGLGAVGWIVLLFALAAVGLLAPGPIALVAVVLTSLGFLLEIRRRRGPARPAGEGRRRGAWQEPWRLASSIAVGVGVGALGATVLALLARALIPDVSWDSDVYHLTVPRIYLEHGGFVRIPFNVYSNWPLGIELLFAAAMALDDFVLAKLLHLGFGVATAIACWRIAGSVAESVDAGPVSARPSGVSDAGVTDAGVTTSGVTTSGVGPAGVGPAGVRSPAAGSHVGAGASAPVTAGSRIAGTGMVAACCFLANPVVLAEMTVAYVDLASAFFLLLGLAAIHAALERAAPSAGANDDPLRLPHPARSALLLAGISAGALCAIKVTGFLAAASLAALLALEAWRARWPTRRLARGLLLIGIPAALLLLPWLVKSWVLTGNPVYPFLYPLFGGPEWSASLSADLARWQREIGMGREPLDYLLLPLRVALEGGDGYAHFDGRISPLWLILVPLSVAAAWRDRLVRRALILAGLSFVAWAATSQQMRFLVPVLALLAVAAARALAELIRVLGRWPKLARWMTPAPSLLAVGLLLWFAWPWGRVALDNLPALTRHYHELRGALVDPAHRFVNEALPPDARLLMLDHNRRFFVERDVLADSFLEASQIGERFRDDDPAAAARRLETLGITHVLVERKEPGARYPEGLLAVIAAATPIYRSPDGRITIHELPGSRRM